MCSVREIGNTHRKLVNIRCLGKHGVFVKAAVDMILIGQETDRSYVIMHPAPELMEFLEYLVENNKIRC
jgi:hypothetical protein